MTDKERDYYTRKEKEPVIAFLSRVSDLNFKPVGWIRTSLSNDNFHSFN